MLIRLGYDISFETPIDVPIVALLNVHASRTADLLEPDVLRTEPERKIDTYTDSFGNQCSRIVAPAGTIRFYNSTLIQDNGKGDVEDPEAPEVPVGELPTDVLRYLLPSRYSEVDLLSNVAAELFGNTPNGWRRVKAICEWVNSKVTFGYHFARSTKTALDVYTERTGGVSRLSTSSCHVLSRSKHSCTVRDRLPGRHRGSPCTYADGLQCLVRSLFRRPLVDLRCAP